MKSELMGEGGITQRQIDNLAALALGLSELPEGYRHFSMDMYYGGSHSPKSIGELVDDIAEDGCGTTACACGHGPSMGIGLSDVESFAIGDVKPFATADDSNPLDRSIDWDDYSMSAFGMHAHSTLAFSHIWHWCFSAPWGLTYEGRQLDNTPQGAACRIVAALEGNIPDEYVDVFTTRSTDQPYAVSLILNDKPLPYDNDHTKIKSRLEKLGLLQRAIDTLEEGFKARRDMLGW